MATEALVHLDDLAAPRFSPEATDVLAAMATLAPTAPLEVDAVVAQARAETGLDDLGDPGFAQRLGVLVTSLTESNDLSDVGRVLTSAQLVQLARNRLLLEDRWRRHPAERTRTVEAPIVIAGLPRTGTTHLHQLLAADPSLRSLPYWESLEPLPLPGEEDLDPDPRLARTEAAIGFMDLVMPHFRRMHEMTTWHVHEEIQLLAIDASTMLFETNGLVPAWTAWYRDHDQAPHYRYLRDVLATLDAVRPDGGRWVLKSPQHVEQLPVLRAVFPDATVVLTHRDPATVVVSMATMVAYSLRLRTRTVDPTAVGRAWADRIEDLLRACVRDRDALGEDRAIDLRLDEVVADPLGCVQRICALADHPVTDEVEAAVARYVHEHRLGRSGRVDYRAADVGLDLDELRARFAFYTDRFLVDG